MSKLLKFAMVTRHRDDQLALAVGCQVSSMKLKPSPMVLYEINLSEVLAATEHKSRVSIFWDSAILALTILCTFR